MRFRWGQALLVFLLLWLLILLYLIFPMWRSSENEEKLVRAQGEVLRLTVENEKLRELLKNVEEQLDSLRKVHKNAKTAEVEVEEQKADKLREEVSTYVDGPSKRYELQRRKIRRDLNEFWFFVRSKLEQAQKISTEKSIQVWKSSIFLKRLIIALRISPQKNVTFI